MPSPFPCSPVIRECSRKKTQIEKKMHRSYINTKKDRCGVAFHFTNKCRDQENPHAFLKIQPIEQVSIKEDSEFDPLAQTKILASLIVY